MTKAFFISGGQPSQIAQVADISRFVLAGNSLFTLRSSKTGKRFTYKVRKPDDFNAAQPIRFVSYLHSAEEYGYLGMIRGAMDNYIHGHKSAASSDSAVNKAFDYFWNHIRAGAELTGVEFFHEGRCGRCNRSLTVPESIQSGFGPECIGKI